MKKILILLAIVLLVHKLWETMNPRLAPQFEQPYVAVYGRDSCAITQRLLSEIRSAGMNYRYFIVDDREVADSLHARMEASGISTRRYKLPVVDVNGALSVRPDFSDVTDEYGSGS